ncbi:MAG: glycosyltransferase family 9 protein [Myxococcaceae bacterium]|nr:glycosyltransferase family 9 protein [Myxococcaceae bacterium]
MVSPLKRLEHLFKVSMAVLWGLVFFRRGRKERALQRLPNARRVLLVRIDNRVGEALLMTPLLEALAGKFEVDVLVHTRCARVLEGHPRVRKIIPFERSKWWLLPLAPGIGPLRKAGYDVVVNCANWDAFSGTAALVSRAIGTNACVVGPSVGANVWVTDVTVPQKTGTTSEAIQRLELLRVLGVSTAQPRMSFRVPRLHSDFREWLAQLPQQPLAVVNPGGRLDWRRVPAGGFIAAAAALKAAGRIPIITWGPGEEPLARGIARAVEGAVLARATNLDELAALMQHCGLTVCNNTGPMHLSVAAGVPTLAFFVHISIERWGHPFAPHAMVDLTQTMGDPAKLEGAIRHAVTEFSATRAARAS